LANGQTEIDADVTEFIPTADRARAHYCSHAWRSRTPLA
jgi:hypothetical protein